MKDEELRRRISDASMPVGAATASGVKGASAATTASRPWIHSPAGPGSMRPSSARAVTTAARRRASVPGRMARWRSASSAVRLRRGSTTTRVPPRARIASIRPGQSGAVARLPLEA